MTNETWEKSTFFLKLKAEPFCLFNVFETPFARHTKTMLKISTSCTLPYLLETGRLASRTASPQDDCLPPTFPPSPPPHPHLCGGPWQHGGALHLARLRVPGGLHSDNFSQFFPSSKYIVFFKHLGNSTR